MRFLISGYPYLVLVSRGSEVRVYEQIKGSRTQHAIVSWISSGHKQVQPKRFLSPMAPWWRALYGALGHAVDMHEHGAVPVTALVALGTLCVLTMGLLLICCLTWSSSSAPSAEAAR